MEINPDTLEIEIVDIEPIDGGVQVFARAWSEGKQIGFGKDGTVDIERFRFFNPPILVEDPNGTVIIEHTEVDVDGTQTTLSRTLREDPEQALLVSLFDTISVMKNVFNDSNLISGKKGSTTSTFYAANGDGGILGFQTESTPTQALWDELHDAPTLGGSTSGLVSSTGTSGDLYVCRTVRINSANSTQIGREFFPFDTSTLPDGDTISSATFSVYGAKGGGSGTSITLGLVQTFQASNTTIALSDWDTCGDTIDNPTEGASRVTISGATLQYWDFNLNATGISWIDKTGFTKLGRRTSEDMDDAFPSTSTDKRSNTYYSENTGTTTDPKLVVEHSAGGGPTANNSARRMLLMQM